MIFLLQIVYFQLFTYVMYIYMYMKRYRKQIIKLHLENPNLTPIELSKLVGCKLTTIKLHLKIKNDNDCKSYFSNRALRDRYGISNKEYNDLLISQNNVCAICGGLSYTKRKTLFVDHDHLNGNVRGLLCLECNHGIGIFKENIDLLQKAIKYINNQKPLDNIKSNDIIIS